MRLTAPLMAVDPGNGSCFVSRNFVIMVGCFLQSLPCSIKVWRLSVRFCQPDLKWPKTAGAGDAARKGEMRRIVRIGTAV
jgi:hypothetical protein